MRWVGQPFTSMGGRPDFMLEHVPFETTIRPPRKDAGDVAGYVHQGFTT